MSPQDARGNHKQDNKRNCNVQSENMAACGAMEVTNTFGGSSFVKKLYDMVDGDWNDIIYWVGGTHWTCLTYFIHRLLYL